jgi:hypothetical protein
MSSNFFMSSADCDAGYKNVRDRPDYVEYKNYVESLWHVYEPYADGNLLKQSS